jgi:hypothetical protein
MTIDLLQLYVLILTDNWKIYNVSNTLYYSYVIHLCSYTNAKFFIYLGPRHAENVY